MIKLILWRILTISSAKKKYFNEIGSRVYTSLYGTEEPKLNYKYAADYLYTIENGCIQKSTSDRAKIYYSNDGVTSNCILARLEQTKIVLMNFGVIYFTKSLLIELIKHFAINIYIMKQKLFS